jgi:hypothetical protein
LADPVCSGGGEVEVPAHGASLGSDHINTVANLIAASEFPLAVATARLTYNASIFRAGVNYKF